MRPYLLFGTLCLCVLLAIVAGIVTLRHVSHHSPPEPRLASARASNLVLDADLGIEMNRVVDLSDSPGALGTASAQALIDFAFRLLRETHPDVPAAPIARERSALRSTSKTTHEADLRGLSDFTRMFLKYFSPDEKGAYFIGAAATQAMHNAAHLHQPQYVRGFKAALASGNQLDAVFPAMRDLRMGFMQVTPSDWRRQYATAYAIQAVPLNASLQRPEEVDAVLVAAGKIHGSGPRNNSGTLYFETVTNHGNLHTISSYTDAGLAAPAGRLHCGVDHPGLPRSYAAFPVAIDQKLPMNETAGLLSSAVLHNMIKGCAYFEHAQNDTYAENRETENSVMMGLLHAADREGYAAFSTALNAKR